MLSTVVVVKWVEEHSRTSSVSLLDGDTMINCEFIRSMFFVVADITDFSWIIVDLKHCCIVFRAH